MKRKDYIIMFVGMFIVMSVGNYFVKKNNDTPKIKITNEKEVFGTWIDRGGTTWTFQNDGLLVGSMSGGFVFFISRYFMAEDVLYTIQSGMSVANEGEAFISKSKKTLRLFGNTDHKKANGTDNYSVVKDASEVVGLWIYETNNTALGYSFYNNGSLILFVGDTPMQPTLKYFISNDMFYTINKGVENTDSFPLILSRDKKKLYIFGNAKREYVKIMENKM